MALTVTTMINAQSVGTSTNVGSDKFPTKLALAGTTVLVGLEIVLVNGATEYDARQPMDVYYVTTTQDLTAANAPAQFRQSAKKVSVMPARGVSGIAIKFAEPAYVQGGFCYVWCEVPNTTVASALTVKAVEIPL